MASARNHPPTPPQAGRPSLEYLPVEALTPDPQNAREHTRAQIKQIARSIEAFGFGSPILVDRDLKVIAGHGRLEALRHLGRTEAPVIRLEHLTPEQARAYAIADNRLTETSTFNERQLALHMKALAEIELDFSLEATGFSMGEIDLMIDGLELGTDGSDAMDEPPATVGPAICRQGDLWLLGDHKSFAAARLNRRPTPAFSETISSMP